jgi:hypothetical protein
MAFEQNDMSGSLFKNDRKEQENQPDYKGSCKIAGNEMWMSAWLKTGQNGTKFMSFAFQLKQQQPPPPQQQQQQYQQPAQQQQLPQNDGGYNVPVDDIPFSPCD